MVRFSLSKLKISFKSKIEVLTHKNDDAWFNVWNRYGGKRGGPGGAGGESFELGGDKAGAEEEGEALRVAKWISWRKEKKGKQETTYRGRRAPKDA